MNYNPEKVAKDLAERLHAPEYEEALKLELELAHLHGGKEAIQENLDALKVVTGK